LYALKVEEYPLGWKGVFGNGIYKVSTLILEDDASYDLWMWHAFFWQSGRLMI